MSTPPVDPPTPPVAAALALIAGAQRVAVICHISPDGDAIGSLLGMSAGLRALGKAVTPACDDGVPSTYMFLAGAKDVAVKLEGEFDLVVTVDCADLPRAGRAAAAVAIPGRPLLNLDHHVTNTRFGSVNWIDTEATSASEIVLDLLDALGVPLDVDIATALMSGLITDTQGFRTSNVNPRALQNAARLTAAGAPAAHLAEITLNRRSFRSLCLWSKALSEMKLEAPGLLWTHITQAMRRACEIPDGGESSLATFLLSAEEVCMSAVFIERADGKVEMSFRAKPGYNVASVALSLGGGGHPPASGCMIPGALAEVEERVLAELRKALEQQQREQQQSLNHAQ